jgi:putative transposase
VRRSFKYPLRPTKVQAATMTAWLDVCADLYNAALQERRDAWRIAKRTISRFDQSNELTELRAADASVRDVSVHAERHAIWRVDRAFKDFFRRCKNGERPGYPRFKSRRRYESFSFPFVSVTGNRVFVAKLGPVRFHCYRHIEGTPKQVTVRRESGGKWSVSISCDLGDAPQKLPVRSAIGIDLGLTAFATISDGSEIPNPRWLENGHATLKRRQQALCRRQRGSASRERARIQVARAHAHIANQRKDFGRKLAVELYRRHDLIAYEDLNIRGMVRGSLGKSINDAAWGVFLRCLASKAESAGKHAIAVDPRGTTQRCSGCGAEVRKGLSERTHACPACGLVLGRDHNAALNILLLAPGRGAVEAEKSSAVETEGSKSDPLPRVELERWPK